MFFARCVVWVVERLPKSKFRREAGLILNYADCRKKVIAWHRTELGRLNADFDLQQAALKLVAAMDKAHAEGVKPDDPKYPDIWDYIDWREEVRTNSYILNRFRKTGDERMQRLAEAIREYPQERVDAVMQACQDALKPEKKK
ncbi:MAG: hypothetical protein B7X03_01135 [Parcubacteria group bacterium 21-58-10]|nr:MAG: hypothetical protein B7X03_01135 [Parcubacteria group bacterium 21-58-10]